MNTFPSIFCSTCDCDTMIYGDLIGDDIGFRCMDCDEVVKKENVVLISPDEIQKLGYDVGIKTKTTKKGCSGGACGVQQP